MKGGLWTPGWWERLRGCWARALLHFRSARSPAGGFARKAGTVVPNSQELPDRPLSPRLKHQRSPGSPEAAGRGRGQNSRAPWMSPPSALSGFLAVVSTCSPNLFPVFIFFQFSSRSWLHPHSAQRPLLLSQSLQRNLSVPSTLPGLHFEVHRRGSGRFSPSHQASQTLLNAHGGRGCAGPEDAIVIRMAGPISWN